MNKRLEKKGLSTEIEDDMSEENKKHKLRREKVSLSNGFGPLTKEEKTRLLSYSLTRKYDLYAPQDAATVATCVEEYLQATKEPENLEPDILDTAEPTEESKITGEQPELVEES